MSGLNAYLVFPVWLIREAKMGLSWPTVVRAAISVMLAQHFLPALALGGVTWLFLLKLLPPIPTMAIRELLSPDLSSFPLFLWCHLCDFSLRVWIYVYAAVQRSFSHKQSVMCFSRYVA